ncbi:MAG: hypothetical protein RIC95_12480 [Vicingaceae bacterium]
MSKKQDLKKAVRKAYKEGMSAKEIFESLQADYPDKENLFDSVSNYPSLKQRKKHRLAQYSLIALIVLAVGFTILQSTYGSLILLAFLIYYLLQWNLKSYLYIYVLNGFGAFALLTLLFMQDNASYLAFFATLGYLLSVTGLAIYLDKKLSPNHEKRKLMVEGTNGKKKYRYQYIFKEE